MLLKIFIEHLIYLNEHEIKFNFIGDIIKLPRKYVLINLYNEKMHIYVPNWLVKDRDLNNVI